MKNVKRQEVTPSCDMFNLGSSYFHVPLTTVRHLLTVKPQLYTRIKQSAGLKYIKVGCMGWLDDDDDDDDTDLPPPPRLHFEITFHRP